MEEKYYENGNEIPLSRVEELKLQQARVEWVIECGDCINDAIQELERLKNVVSDELKLDGVFSTKSRTNLELIKSRFIFSLLDIAIFSDQFKRNENKKIPEQSGILVKLNWANLDCTAIDTSASMKLSRYMRNFFAHVRKGKQGFHISIKSELEYGKSCIVDIQKMVLNKEIRLPKEIGIDDISCLLLDRNYTDLLGNPTGEEYIDLYKFAKSLPIELHSIWRTFVDTNKVEFEKLSKQTGAFIEREWINYDIGKQGVDDKFIGIDDRFNIREKLISTLNITKNNN